MSVCTYACRYVDSMCQFLGRNIRRFIDSFQVYLQWTDIFNVRESEKKIARKRKRERLRDCYVWERERGTKCVLQREKEYEKERRKRITFASQLALFRISHRCQRSSPCKNSHGDFKVIQALPIYKTRKRLSFPATWSCATLSVFNLYSYLQNLSLLCAFIFGRVSWLLCSQGSSRCIPRSFSGIGCTH